MTGLEKITERILAEGRERARVIMQEAEEDCRRIAADYAERADVIRRELADNGESEGERLVEDARIEAQRMHERIIADARRSVIDAVIDGAKKKLCNSQQNKYRDLLIALLSSALIEQDREERERAERGEEIIPVQRFEVLMNGLDHDTFGLAVVEGGRHLAERRIGADKAARVVLSHERITIDGGLLLRFDDVLVDCSLDTLLSRIYEQMKEELDELLFAE